MSGPRALLPCCLALLSACDGPAGDPAAPSEAALADRLCAWEPHPRNPLIEAPPGAGLIADPTVLAPNESPDGRWHLFAHSLVGIHRYVSDDGLEWARLDPQLFGVGDVRPFLYPFDGRWHLLWEHYSDLSHSELRLASSPDLATWTEPSTILRPDLAWEQDPQWRVGNPYVLHRDGRHWLYYSGNGVLLPDCGFSEPTWIGVARAVELVGPWEKEPEPLIGPSDDTPDRNLGAGSLKLLDERVGGRWVALNNGIYVDADGRTGSSIHVLASDDGLAWEDVCGRAIVAPSGDGWDRAFIYAFDTVRAGDTLRVYFNARDGWNTGTERIGLATLALPRP